MVVVHPLFLVLVTSNWVFHVTTFSCAPQSFDHFMEHPRGFRFVAKDLGVISARVKSMNVLDLAGGKWLSLQVGSFENWGVVWARAAVLG